MNKKLILGLVLLGMLSAVLVAATVPYEDWDFIGVFSIDNVLSINGTTADFDNVAASNYINFTDGTQQINVVNSTCLNITSGTGWISVGC